MQRRSSLIAIIEDDAFLRRALERILHARDYQTAGFESAEAFLQHGPERIFDCVILDVALPLMSGLDLYSRLAQRADKPPVIFITGFSTPYIRAAARSLGAIDCLAKPFDAVMLLAAIERAVAMRRLRHPAFNAPY